MAVHNHSNVLAVTFALASALTIAVGTVWRHHILRTGLSHTEANASPLGSLRSAQWWASLCLAFVAYGLQALALGFGSLLVVQPILVLSLMFTLVLSARVERRRMDTGEALWALALTACVGVVIVLGRPVPGQRVAAWWEWAAAIAVGAIACALVVAAAYRRPPYAQALLYGIVCGAVFGYLAVFSKVAVDAFAAGGLPALVSTWQFWAMLAASVLGTAVQQYAFGAGVLSASLPAMKIVEPLIALTLGLTILGESLQVNTVAEWAVMGASISGMLVATGMLARRPVA
ncbi:DMT family transporter [Corynebacterium liangguodongii]|uniref:Uncharacterized protein n=1 Tax=Corynebacterium liangguodongii TaxID=2079535 RepID=A0A2S0WBP8_9CORY|nr:DMT family transporter [Corynebacterium liangguodongii]AWB83199.1 hypothetical protein C3E79_00805 [Corynebacterium liangguodongii]PWB98794.1 hypothetical protein DF219_10265 [Corynebacterium liangguodongii]